MAIRDGFAFSGRPKLNALLENIIDLNQNPLKSTMGNSMNDLSRKKIMILHNFERNDYLKLLASMETSGLSDGTIVAVTTPVTLDWKVKDLLNELLLEDENVRKEKGE